MLNSGNITFFSFLQAFLNLVFIAVSSEANGTLRGRLRIGHNACDVYRLCESANRHVNPLNGLVPLVQCGQKKKVTRKLQASFLKVV